MALVHFSFSCVPAMQLIKQYGIVQCYLGSLTLEGMVSFVV